MTGCWLRNYAISREVVSSRPDEVNYFSSIYVVIPATLVSVVYCVSSRNEYQKQKMKFESIGLPTRKADNLTAICEPTV
jgi:hypothetical protein